MPPSSSTTASFRLSNRIQHVGFSDIVQIRNKVMDLRAQGKAVHQFEGGEPYLPTPQHIKDAMTRALAREVKERGGMLIIASHNRTSAQELAKSLECRHVAFEALYTTMHDVLIV